MGSRQNPPSSYLNGYGDHIFEELKVKPAERIALIYGLSLAGAGAISYARGRSGQQIATDAVIHGLVAGTGFNVVAWLYTEYSGESALGNGFHPIEGAGNLGQKAVALLNAIADKAESDGIFDPLHEEGVKVAPVPDDPTIVAQE